MTVLQRCVAHLRKIFTQDIWHPDILNDWSPRGRFYAVLRVLAMTWNGVFENNLASRAGALCFSSMLGMGPLVALVVTVSGVLLQRSDPDFAVNQLNRALVFIAPQVRQLQAISEPAPETGNETAPDSATATSDAADGTPKENLTVNPELVGLLNNFIEGSKSKALGIAGALVLILIVIQLFTSVENAFNDIWGVKRGRNWLLRIVYYWAAVTLGAVLAFASLALLGAAAFITTIESLPLGPEIRQLIVWAGPFISGLCLIVILAVFYRFIPNTSVNWWPSVTGATTVVVLLYLNNLLAIFYVRQVIVNQSLFGSFGILPILMLGMYVFWLIVLVGGQITYATQNANYRSSHMAWNDLTYSARQGLALLVLILVARRFRDCRKPLNAHQISQLIKIPAQLINACLSRLIELGLVSPIPAGDNSAIHGQCYQPARPLNRVTLQAFKQMFERIGHGPEQEVLDTLDPVVRDFHTRIDNAVGKALGEETLDDIIERMPANNLLALDKPGPVHAA